MMKDPTDKTLRARGYMTPEEFVDRLVPGLKEYLGHNWGGEVDLLMHPEDLVSNAEIYLKVAYHVFVDFGVAGPKKPNQTTINAMKELFGDE